MRDGLATGYLSPADGELKNRMSWTSIFDRVLRAALTHSRKVVVHRAGVVLNAECYTDSGRITRVWLP